MNDNEKVVSLVNSILQVVNESQLPLSVKALALDNVLLNVKMAMQPIHIESSTSAKDDTQNVEDDNNEGNARNAMEAN